MNRRAPFVAAVVAVLVVAALGGGRVAAQDAPGVRIEPGTVAAGSTATVTASGWVPGVLVTIEVCGNEGRNSATDCADDEAVAVRADAAGFAAAALRVTAPPAPCPCVVRATSTVSLDGGVVTPIVITGAAQRTTSGPADVERQLVVASASLSDGGWAERFALGHERILHFEVVNDGNVPIADPPLSVAVSVGSGAPAVVSVGDVGRIEPGQRRTVRVAVPVGALEWGDVVVEGQLPGFAREVRFDARSGGRPWGALTTAALAVGGVVVLIVRARRRRRGALVSDRPEPPIVIDLRDRDGAVTIDLRELAQAWGAYGPPDPADVEAALRRTLVADLAPLYGLNPNDPADEPYLRAMVERTATRTLAYLRDPAAGLDGPVEPQGDSSTTNAVATNPS